MDAGGAAFNGAAAAAGAAADAYNIEDEVAMIF
jgi:hypothetical protein